MDYKQDKTHQLDGSVTEWQAHVFSFLFWLSLCNTLPYKQGMYRRITLAVLLTSLCKPRAACELILSHILFYIMLPLFSRHYIKHCSSHRWWDEISPHILSENTGLSVIKTYTWVLCVCIVYTSDTAFYFVLQQVLDVSLLVFLLQHTWFRWNGSLQKTVKFCTSLLRMHSFESGVLKHLKPAGQRP